MRSNGILCAISSLPSKYGVGDLGYPSYQFAKELKEAGIKYWQILPLNPTDVVNSPYASECDLGIDYVYVSLELLKEEGYLKNIKKFAYNEERVNYREVRAFKDYYLRKAFKNQNDLENSDYLNFVSDNPWVKKYALFKIISKKYHGAVPYEWKKKDRDLFYKDKKFSQKDIKEMNFVMWVQFILNKQLNLLKKVLKENEVILIGDIPFYVGLNSSDFIANIDNFVTDENDCPSLVAGVPPDYFSPLGQLWGNPIYDVKFMKEDNYSFFLNRIRSALKKYDVLRLDHFRAFDTYYEVPFGSENAVNGKWKNGLGSEFFDILKEENLLDRIIVEDLGDVFPSVYQLRDKYNLPGMNIIQFTMFDKKFDYIENQVIYTGTHDNDTIVGFYKKMSNEDKELLKIKFRYENIVAKLKINMKFIEFAFKQDAYLVIVPVQDYLGLSNKYRMNVPGIGKEGANWGYRLSSFKDFEKVIPEIKKLIKKYSR